MRAVSPKVAILVPRRADNGARDRLWRFTKAWWAEEFPDWPIVEGHHHGGQFNRSAAINTAAALAGDWDVACIIDADVLCDWDAVRTAVSTAVTEKAMVVAGDERHHLNRRATTRILDGYRGPWGGPKFVERTFTEHWSSCVVVTRELWDAVGGFDPLFEGWGYEDDAFKVACETVSGKPMIRIHAPIWHLHHARSSTPTQRKANRARADRYLQAAGDPDAIGRLTAEASRPEPATGPTRIPRILHRTVPAETSDQVETWWAQFERLHPGWETRTWRDPLDPADWPETGDLWDRCSTGAQKAGLIRLEALYTHGGVYVDSDVEPYRSLEPLLTCAAFAGWEDNRCVPDAVLAAEPAHPAFRAMLDRARQIIEAGGSAWDSGPGVTTAVLPGRPDVTLLPPGSFYPYHYTEKHRANEDHRAAQPWAFMAHHWAGSWLTPAQIKANQARKGRR